jgi:nickel/cobalt transporter (NicO) family protein
MDFNYFLQQGAAHAWLYLPVAVFLGALHGLEPGHSKTMMAAFIIAVRGTVMQAALLGLSAAISHSFVIWVLAALALRFGSRWNVETTEPYFLMGTGVLVVGMAVWTLWRLKRGASSHHHHHDENKTLETPDGLLELSIFEDGVPPRFRIAVGISQVEPVLLRTIRPDGDIQVFSFVRLQNFWESNETIPEPHAFRVEAILKGPAGESTVTVDFSEDHDHAHDQSDEEDDAHSRAHAEDIRRRFDGREVTTGQIILFGLTGGLMPCPAAFSILLICLQLKEFTLGFSLVAGFSFGLALTLVTVGVVAAWGMRQVSKQTGALNRWAHRAPYLSSILLIILGIVFFLRGVWHVI